MKTNRIELDKGQGLTIKVINGAREQTIFLDGNQITITVKDGAQQSRIVQTPTSVMVDADNFVVLSKNIRCTARIKASLTSGTSNLTMTPASANLKSELTQINTQIPPSMVQIGALTSETMVKGVNVDVTAATALTVKAPAITETGVVLGPPPIPPL